jgi:hypothetical protein
MGCRWVVLAVALASACRGPAPRCDDVLERSCGELQVAICDSGEASAIVWRSSEGEAVEVWACAEAACADLPGDAVSTECVRLGG